MVFTLYGHSEVACTRRVALIAKERNVPYKLVTVDVKGGEHKQPAYLKHQPFGQVPYIIVRRFSFPPSPSPAYFAVCLMRASFFIARRWL